ncbi:MAG: DMT family transporter [Anaerolineae bacterium]
MEQESFSAAMPVAEPRVGTRFSRLDVAMLGVVLIWGLNFVALKVGLSEINTLAFAGIRFAIATLTMVVLVRITRENLRVQKGDFWKIMGLGVMGQGGYQVIFMSGMARWSAGPASLILATSPIWVALIGRVTGERISRWAWLGILLSFGGLLLLIQGGVEGNMDAEHIWGGVLLLLSAIGWALYTVVSRPFLHRYSPLKLTALTMVLGTWPLYLVALPSAIQQNWRSVSPVAWASLIYSALFAIVVAYVIWYVSIQRVGSARTSVYSNLVPVVAMILAWVLLGERIAPIQLVGGAIVLFGIALTRKK